MVRTRPTRRRLRYTFILCWRMVVRVVRGSRFSCFFSSRRRHTICSRDWSSDVCSSDLLFTRVLELLREKDAADIVVFGGGIIPPEDVTALKAMGVKEIFTPGASTQEIVRFVRERSEERRVGEE